MHDRRRQLPHGGDPGDVGELLAQSLGLRLGPSTLADVDHRGHHEAARHGVDGVEADLNGHLAAVPAAAEEVPPDPHRARPGIAHETGTGLQMFVREALGDQRLDQSAASHGNPATVAQVRGPGKPERRGGASLTPGVTGLPPPGRGTEDGTNVSLIRDIEPSIMPR